MVTNLQRHLWTRTEYDRAVEAGVFEPSSKIELIDGDLVEIEVTQSPRHASTISRLTALLGARYGITHVRVQLPLAVSPTSEPEPDLAIVPGNPEDYREAHPTIPSSVVEVSDTPLRIDQTTKAMLYARAGIPTYWIVDLINNIVEVCTHPHLGGYLDLKTHCLEQDIREGPACDDIIRQ